MYGDKILCLTCGGFTKDLGETREQDSRLNPKWVDTCAHCGSIKTLNATYYIEKGKSYKYIPINTSKNPISLRAHGRLLKQRGIIKEFTVEKLSRKNTYRLYERIRVKRLLKRSVDKRL